MKYLKSFKLFEYDQVSELLNVEIILLSKFPATALLSAGYSPSSVIWHLCSIGSSALKTIFSTPSSFKRPFDKTGTLTTGILDGIEFIGQPLTMDQKKIIISVAHSSTHPLSRAIVQFLHQHINLDLPDASNFEEVSGKGIEAICDTKKIRIGSRSFVGDNSLKNQSEETSVSISIDEQYVGKFIFRSELRDGIDSMLKKLKN